MQRLLVVLLVLCAGAARAQDGESPHTFRAVVDRVDLEPSTLTGTRLRVYLSALSLEGKRLDLTEPKSIKLYVGASEKKLPYALGSFAATQGDTALVVLVQSTVEFTDALPPIADAIDRTLLAALPDRTQIAVLPYGESVSAGRLGAAKALRGNVALASDGSAGDPALLDTLDRALLLLKKARATPEGRPLRKIVVVVGDGRDLAADRERVTRTGQRAAKEGVRIHSIAFSPADVRRPMLALGELSKRSLGTFRWVRTAGADAWRSAFEQLRDELLEQYVVTYFVPAEDDLAGKKLHIVTAGRTETTSNEVKIGPAACSGVECPSGYCASDTCVRVAGAAGRGALGWLALIGGIVAGAILVLGGIGFAITRAQQRRRSGAGPMPYGYPGPPPYGAAGQPPYGQAGATPYGAAGQPPYGQAGATPHGAAGQPPYGYPGATPHGAAGQPPYGHAGATPNPALLIVSGPRAGERHPLRHGFWIGAQPGCDLRIDDGFTSSQHAQIGVDPRGACTVYDRGSTNGTFINGVRVTEGALAHGATLRIGSTEMRFLAE